MELKCRHSYDNRWPNKVKYRCQAVEFSIIEPGTRTVTFKDHVEGKTNIDVEIFSIYNLQIEIFPRGLASIFANIKNVKMINCAIKEISREDFKGLVNLEYLDLSYNKLRSLPNDLFVETPNLQWIHLSDNDILRLSSKIFEPLHKKIIKEFFLAKNRTVDMNYEQGGKITFEAFLNKIDLQCLPPIEKCLNKPLEPPIGHHRRFPKYEEYFVTGKFSDFTIKVRNKEYKVHKIVLAAQSSVFESMFNKDDVKVLQEIKIMSDDAFEDFLRYFYFGSIRCADNAIELFGLAVEFNVATLKSECEEIILRNIDEHNMLEIFNLGLLHGSENLKKFAFGRIKTSFPRISDNLINAPEVIANIIKAKRELDNVVNAAQSFKICELTFKTFYLFFTKISKYFFLEFSQHNLFVKPRTKVQQKYGVRCFFD